MKKPIDPHKKAPYTRSDLQTYLTPAIAKVIEDIKMPRDVDHDRRLVRALGAIAAQYMVQEGCKDPQFIAAVLVEGAVKECGHLIMKKTTEEYVKTGKKLPSYLTALEGGAGAVEEEDEEEADGDEPEDDEP